MPRGPKNLQISFTGKQLTHFGGVYLLYCFFKKIQLKTKLVKELSFNQRNNRFSISEELLSLVYPIILGLGRIETSHLLRHNGVFQYLTGLPTYPNPTTLRRFLLRMAPLALPKLRALYDKLLSVMSRKPEKPISVIFDLDSTVLTLYGKQELARVGYNPLKPGRVSYHPLLCFNGLTKDYWHGELRSGDTHTS
ncbi:MAG: transposase, partial [Nitrososphaeraceae archaeon]